MRPVVLAACLALAAALAWPGPASADQIVHSVQPGENLFRIGLKYGVSWQSIMAANGLTTTWIYAGEQLIIPVGDPGPAAAATEAGPASAAPTEAAPTAAAPTEAVAIPAGGTHTVTWGESLGAIARRFGVTTQALAAANGISNYNLIFSGQVLTIPGQGETAAPVAAPPSAPAASKLILIDISEQHMYVFENGSGLWSWVTSTGERGRETAPGHYSVLNKIPNAYGATWNLWMPHWLGIYWAGYLQNGIHALPILSDGSKLWAGWLGTPVSFGCVILSDSDAETLYNWAEVGTPVEIQW